MQRLILPLPGNEVFASELARQSRGELGTVETRRFPDGETYVRLHGMPNGRPVDLICTLARPDAQFLALTFAADAARDLGASEVNLVAPTWPTCGRTRDSTQVNASVQDRLPG